MSDSKNTFKIVGIFVVSFVVIALSTAYYYFLWPKQKIFWTLTSNKKAVRELMKSYLQNKYKEDFEVEPPVQLADYWGSRLMANAFPQKRPQVKFEIRTEHFRFADPFSQEMVKNGKLYESFFAAQWGYRLYDFLNRVKSEYPQHFPSEARDFGSVGIGDKYNSLYETAKNMSIFIRSIAGEESDFKKKNLFKIIQKEGADLLPPVPSVFYEVDFYLNKNINILEESDKFCSIFKKHLLAYETKHYVMAVLFFEEKEEKNVEEEFQERRELKPWEIRPVASWPLADQIAYASASWRYGHFLESLESDHRKGALKNALVFSSYELGEQDLSKEALKSFFLY